MYACASAPQVDTHALKITHRLHPARGQQQQQRHVGANVCGTCCPNWLLFCHDSIQRILNMLLTLTYLLLPCAAAVADALLCCPHAHAADQLHTKIDLDVEKNVQFYVNIPKTLLQALCSSIVCADDSWVLEVINKPMGHCNVSGRSWGAGRSLHRWMLWGSSCYTCSGLSRRVRGGKA